MTVVRSLGTPYDFNLGTVGYVLSPAYSGSTLLSFLLDSLPDVACIGEMVDVVDRVPDKAGYPCSCGMKVRDCEFWSRVGQQMAVFGHEFGADNWRLHFRVAQSWLGQRLTVRPLQNWYADAVRDTVVRHLPPWGPALREIAMRNRACMAAVLKVTGKTIFVDASKDTRRVVLLRDLADIKDPFIIHLVRDPIGFASSEMRHLNTSVESAAREWNRITRHIDRLRHRTERSHWLMVRYEDLCRDPAGELNRIAIHLGSRPGPANLTLDRSSGHVRGNQMRLGGSSEITVDESWRRRLSTGQVNTICRITASYREDFGYPPFDDLEVG